MTMSIIYKKKIEFQVLLEQGLGLDPEDAHCQHDHIWGVYIINFKSTC